MLRFLTLAVFMGTCALTAAEDKKPAKFDPAKLVGDWTITEGMKAGEKVENDLSKGVVTITKDKITLDSMGMKFVFGYKIDAAKDPVAIDMEIDEPEALKGGKAPGIVKLEDGKLTLIYSPMEGTRPTKFESTKDNGYFLFVHKMKKDEKKDK